MENCIAVSRFLPNQQKEVMENPGPLLRELRSTVQQVRQEEPHLADYQLYDMGFVQREDGLEVNLYFIPDE
ncbi:MAG: hypothetical protein ACYDG6_00295 [Thermincolia bacterium]